MTLPGLFDVDALVRAVALTWSAQPKADRGDDFVHLSGQVEAAPAPDAIERELSRIGFACRVERGAPPSARGTCVVAGRRGAERIRCSLLDASVTIEWQSGLLRQVIGGKHEWRQRVWPVYFDDALVRFESAAFLVVEGRPPASVPEALERYRAWAAANGLHPYAAHETHLNGAFSVADDGFVVTLIERGALMTMTVQSRP